jgi:hypothetical protein
MKKNILFALAAVILISAAAEPLMAYTLLSPARRWASTPINVPVYNVGNNSINDSDKGVTAVVGAVKAWGIVNSSATSSPAVRGSAPATIMLNTNGNICSGSCLAATLTGYYSASGGSYVIYDADVYTSKRHPFFSSRETDGCSGEYDIDGIMVHEVGHVIGLGHSSVSGATMYPSVSACNTANRSLEADDIAGKNALY